MLFNWDIARLRAEIASKGNIEKFGHFHVHHTQVAPQPSLGGLRAREVAPSSSQEFRTPECIFGKPEKTACLDGVVPGTRPLPAQTIYTLANALVIGTIAAISDDNLLVCDGPATSHDDLERIYKSNLSNAHGFVLTKTNDEFVAHYLAAPAERLIRGKTVFLTSQEIGNYGCFLYWTLPQIIVLSEQYRDRIDQYVVTDRTSWLLDAIALLGLPPRPIYTVSEICGTRFESLTMMNVISPEGFFHPALHTSFLHMAGRLRIVDSATPRATRKLYVSRILSHVRSPSYRPLGNEQQVMQLVADRGYEIVLPETLAFYEQIRLFDSAAIVVGPSGSGMLGTMFAPSGTVVIDFESFTVSVRQHARIYSSTSKTYSFCFGQFDLEDERADAPMRRWILDMQNVRAALDWAEAVNIC